MHLRCFLAGLATLTLLSAPALSAPLGAGDSPAGSAASAAQALLPTQPVNRPAAAGRVRADRNANGLSDGLEQMLATMAPGERIEVVATFSGPVSFPALGRAIGVFDLRHEFSLIDGFAATMTVGQARALAAVPGVFRVEEDFTVSATLETARRDFGVESLVADPLTTGVTGAGIGICVADTGVDAGHEQFTDEATGATKVLGFQDFIGDINGVPQALAYDDHGHGTHVSGIAAGDGTGSELGVQLRGVAPGADLYVAKVLDANGFGANSIVIQGVEWCNQPGVQVVNLSLTEDGSSDGQDALSLTVNALADAGKIVVIGAGNAGSAPFTIGSPAAAAGGIAVGAAAEWSGDPVDLLAGQWYSPGVFRAPFSSSGPTADGRIKPDIMAPGHSIASAFIDPFNIWGCANECYGVLSGTSMASPFVAGTVALMLDAALAPMTTDEVMQILAATAQDRGVVGKDNDWGHGLLDAYAAVAAAQGLTGLSTVFPVASFGTGSVSNGGSTLIPIEVTDPSAPLAVTILNDGSLGAFGWSPDLEARLLDGNGQPFLMANPLYPFLSDEPFMAVPGTESICPAGLECGAVGRQETVWIDAPAVGSYFLEVFSFDGFPNNGKGGTFSYVTSNAVTASPPPNTPPLAAFAESCTDLGCAFTDTSSDSDGIVSAWAWNFGDGNGSSLQNPSHSYAVAGTYPVTLTVTDDDGDSDAASHNVTVTAPNSPPLAAFTKSCTDLACGFTDTSSDSDGTVTAWAWDFGDGNGSSAQDPSHSYAAAGTYTVTLTVTDDDGDSDATLQGVTVIAPNSPPVAAFTKSCTDLGCAFTDTSSDSDGTVSAWAWDFGDGNGSSAQDPSHSYAAAGTYTVTLTVIDDRGASDAASQDVTLAALNSPPVAAFTESCTDLGCDFTDSSSDSDGTVSAWAWDFGDGNVSTAQNPSHGYAAAGTYTVILTVTDDDGDSDATSHGVTVSAPPNSPPVAAFTESCTDLGCDFTDTSSDSDGTVSAWAWNFGDGNTSSAQNPSHSYAAAGTYMVSLTVTDNDGASTATSHDVTVTDMAPALTVLGCSPDNGNLNDRMTVRVTGTGFQDGVTADFGPRIAVQAVTFVSATELDIRIKIRRRATRGAREVTISNPDGLSGTSSGGCFTVN